MTDSDGNLRGNVWRITGLVVGVFALVMLAGVIAGFLAEHSAQGGGALSAAAVAVLAVVIALIGGVAYAMWRTAQKVRLSGEPLTRREKLNRQIVIGCMLIGALIGMTMAISGDLENGNADIFSNGPLSPVVAAGLATLVGIVMPLVSWFWHNRAIDEQEADAYRSGALIAIYAYWIIAPTWWLLWRGGLVPAPDGIAIYMITIFTAGGIWLWKKYR